MVPVPKVNYFNKFFRIYLGRVNSLTVPALESKCFSSSGIENVHTNHELECDILAPSPDIFIFTDDVSSSGWFDFLSCNVKKYIKPNSYY